MQSSSANASTREQASHGPKESAASLREKVVRMQLELEAAEAREQQAHARKQNRGQDILVAQSPSPSTSFLENASSPAH